MKVIATSGDLRSRARAIADKLCAPALRVGDGLSPARGDAAGLVWVRWAAE